MENYHQLKQMEDMEKELREWLDDTYVELNPNYLQNILKIREKMPNEIEVPKLSMLEYQRAIIEEFKADYSFVDDEDLKLDFTDKELELNRREKDGQKITKILTKVAKSGYRCSDQRIDFFSKLRREDDRYFIYSDPIEFLKRYKSVQTCVSPTGENQSNIYRFLFSPYTYIIGNLEKTARMIAHIDFERRYVFLYPIYGEYDGMMAYSVAKFFVENDFTFPEIIDYAFELTQIFKYLDRTVCGFLPYIKSIGGKILNEPLKKDEACNLFERPKNIAGNEDLFLADYEGGEDVTISGAFHDQNGVRYEGEYYCECCGEIVNESYYDYDAGCCFDCVGDRGVYCEHCHEDVAEEDYNFSYDMCNYCFENNYVMCPDCGEVVSIDFFDSDADYCDDCLQKRGNNEHSTPEEEEEVRDLPKMEFKEDTNYEVIDELIDRLESNSFDE